MPPILADELELLNGLRAMQGMPPLTSAEVSALEAAPEPAFCPLPPATPEEREAIAYVRRVQGLDPAPAATPTSRPSPAAASDLAGLVVPGGPLTDHERAELGQMDIEHRQDGLGPLTADKAAQLVARWRARAA